MKLADVIGFAAIFGAGYFVGKDLTLDQFSNWDIALIVGLLVMGFYLAVVLS